MWEAMGQVTPDLISFGHRRRHSIGALTLC